MNMLERKTLLHVAITLSPPSKFITEYGLGRLSLALELLCQGKKENVVCPLKNLCADACCCCDDVFIDEIIEFVRIRAFCFKPLEKEVST